MEWNHRRYNGQPAPSYFLLFQHRHSPRLGHVMVDAVLLFARHVHGVQVSLGALQRGECDVEVDAQAACRGSRQEDRKVGRHGVSGEFEGKHTYVEGRGDPAADDLERGQKPDHESTCLHPIHADHPAAAGEPTEAGVRMYLPLKYAPSMTGSTTMCSFCLGTT